MTIQAWHGFHEQEGRDGSDMREFAHRTLANGDDAL
jgi:hypothetical protein